MNHNSTDIEGLEDSTSQEHCESATRTQIRGSSLLLAGRFISLAANFLSQLLMVRYLTTTEFGAVAYGLSVVAFCQPLVCLGLQDAASRFIPIFHENEEYDQLFGTIFFILGVTALTGFLTVGVIWTMPFPISHWLSKESLPQVLLPVLIFLVPVQSIDNLLIAVFASFASTRAIFFRRFILDPGLKLAVVLLLLVGHQKTMFLAYGFVAADVLGIVLYTGTLMDLFRRHHLSDYLRIGRLKFPARAILAFSPPGLAAGFVTLAIYGVNATILGYLGSMTQVAFYRAVVPLAQLNNVVMTSFAMLYIPLSSRMFARDDRTGMNHLYWRTTIWMTVLSFPIFAITFSAAGPITVLLYGERYRPSAPILALLALGCYFNVLLGFNLQTLKVLEKLRYIILASVLAALINVEADLLLIPRYEALGAAIGTAGTLILYNLLLQGGLADSPGLCAFDRQYSAVYITIVAGAVGVLAIQRLCAGRPLVEIPLIAAGSALVLALSKKHLNASATFPELLRFPLMKALLS